MSVPKYLAPSDEFDWENEPESQPGSSRWARIVASGVGVAVLAGVVAVGLDVRSAAESSAAERRQTGLAAGVEYAEYAEEADAAGTGEVADQSTGTTRAPGAAASSGTAEQGSPGPGTSAQNSDGDSSGGAGSGSGGAGQSTPTAGTGRGVAPASGERARVSPDWLAKTAQSTGIPKRALQAYAEASLNVSRSLPGCGLGWNTLAGIGYIESGHGTYGGHSIDKDGNVPGIRGVPLDGGPSVEAIPDTDGGRYDGDPTWDRAMGPMQFIPSTWAVWGSDGNGDGKADPDNIDDAAYTTARYLCASSFMTTPEGWRAAVFAYNHSNSYVSSVAKVANTYAARAKQ